MKIETLEINDVTDTALWVAAYRAEESERKDALFKDPYASLLLGEAGSKVAIRTQGSRYTSWSVVIRTYIIDQFIEDLVHAQKIDTILNLGAGLDTRPYRLNVPSSLRWIEVDFPKIIDLKNLKLKDVSPLCLLERKTIDLSIESIRDEFLSQISSESKNVLVLTEGVVPYLSNSDASSLAHALYRHENFSYWISEYYSPEILAFLRTPKRLKQMKNAPFLFYPEDWYGFFDDHGWQEEKTKYFGVESEKIGRTPPTPGWIKDNPEKSINDTKNFLGYSIFKRKSQ